MRKYCRKLGQKLSCKIHNEHSAVLTGRSKNWRGFGDADVMSPLRLYMKYFKVFEFQIPEIYFNFKYM